MLQVKDISKEYRNGELVRVALSNININVNPGDFVMFYGPSGSGKTCLANIIGLLEYPSSGDLIFMDASVTELSERDRLLFRRGKIGYLFSESRLIEELTVYENIELPLVYLKMKKAERKTRVLKVLEDFNMLHRKKQFPKDLTAVQKQKVAIARAIVVEPSVLIADEPTGNLSTTEGDEILDMLSVVNESGITVLGFTHSGKVAGRGQKVVQLIDGHLVRENLLK
ncbi:ABC transporter ATP-binding protein [Plebeiibacterium marinum]|uniref:ABC transporter ATP-binding protein n=1 Tax=Plebeiibacterium marinum TaxID=2992111 RepID=A0AAE3MC23_9BACT|nr:ABC transporter ATP-binding protein [Plebeiobacterium marinum]MCW3804981.1 ABC transporter ATP-binding protein [Plebeiobacterium marinum]